jgi:hypothetical protein
MKFNIRQYGKMLDSNHIKVIYSGPVWANGIDGMAEMLLKRLEFDDIPLNASQSVFSIFVEQMNNMMMYSADKEHRTNSEGNPLEISKGIFILGVQDTEYFIQCGNVVTNYSAEILKTRIDYLNTLDKKGLRQYYKQQMHAENSNLESKGAGVGLIEIARRASAPIDYEFEPYSDGLQYFTIYNTVQQGGKQ